LKQSVIAVALTFGATEMALAQAPATSSVQSVYVTGSNLKRTDKEGTQPIQVITAKDIVDSGATSVTELMRKVPSMGADQNLDTNDGGFSRGVSTASLRGLSSTSTLILLNGRRMTPAAYADPNDGNSTLYDLNAIPLSALERVEILKDGASAIYGSDAIGGVINFITKTNYQGAEVSLRASANDDNHFKRKGANFFFGKGDLDADGYNFFITADVNERDRLVRSAMKDVEVDTMRFLNGRYQTPFGSQISAFPAIYRETGQGTNSFGVTRANMADRLVVRTNCDPSRQLVGSTAMGLLASNVFVGRTFCNYDTNQWLEATSAGKDASVMARGVVKLGAKHRFFVEAARADTKRTYTGSPAILGQTPVTNWISSGVGTPFHAILPIGHPDNPFPNHRASVGYRFENLRGGSQNVNENTRLLAGLQGSLGSWDWETGLLYNGSERKETYFGRLYIPTLTKLSTTSLAALAADPTVARDVNNKHKASITQLDIKANTEMGQLAGGAIGVAVGAEFRRETIKMTPDAELAAGNILGLVNSIIDGERDVKSAFLEVRTPFLKNFEMDFAGRLDKYPGIKTNFVPKIGAKWSVSDDLAFRGTFARGFRAPALVQVTPGGSQFFNGGVFDPKRCEADEETPKPGAFERDCGQSVAGTGGYNPDLVPEKAKSFTIGVLFSPNKSIDLGMEYWRVRKEGEVALGTAFEALRNEDKTPGNIVRDTNPDNFVRDAAGNPVPGTGPLRMIRLPWINQGATETAGIDFDAAYRRNLGEMGNFTAKLTGTYTTWYSLAQHDGDVEHNLVGNNGGIVDWNLSSGLDIPRWKSNASVNWTRGVHSLTLNANYVGPISLLRRYNADVTYPTPFCHYGARKSSDAEQNRQAGNPNYEAWFPECSINSWTTFGMSYTWTGYKGLSVTLNVQNIFDTKAPYDPGVAASTAGAALQGYNEGLHNPYGRYFSLMAKYKF
jgi:iron complex outermembrane receptor protein